MVSGMQISNKRRNGGEGTACPTCMGPDVPSILSLRPLGRFVPHFRNRATIDCHASLAMTWNAPVHVIARSAATKQSPPGMVAGLAKRGTGRERRT